MAGLRRRIWQIASTWRVSNTFTEIVPWNTPSCAFKSMAVMLTLKSSKKICDIALSSPLESIPRMTSVV